MGKLKPDQLTESVLSLVSARPPQQLTDPSLLAMPDDSSQHNRPSAEIIKMMVSLSDRATYAQQCCTTIIVCFRLAVVSLILLKVMRYWYKWQGEIRGQVYMYMWYFYHKFTKVSPPFPQLSLGNNYLLGWTTPYSQSPRNSPTHSHAYTTLWLTWHIYSQHIIWCTCWYFQCVSLSRIPMHNCLSCLATLKAVFARLYSYSVYI